MSTNRTSFVRAALLIVFAAALQAPCNAREAGTTAAEFLKISQGGRPYAMADSYVALANDSYALYFNPAGLGQVNWRETGASYSTWLKDSYCAWLSYVHSLEYYGTAGFAITYLSSGKIEKRTDSKDLEGSYLLQDFSIVLGYGKEVSKGLFLGGDTKIIQEKIEDRKGSTVAFDLGAIYRLYLTTNRIDLGVSVQNIGSSMGPGKESPLPLTVRFGAANWRMNDRLVLSAEADYSYPGIYTASTGVEFFLYETFSLRAGYLLGDDLASGLNGITLGFGILYVENIDYTFDYGIRRLGEFGFEHRVSVGVKF